MKRFLILIFILALSLSGCSQGSLVHSEFMMDTIVTYNLTHTMPQTLVDECNKLTARLEEMLSAYDEESAISQFNTDGELLLSTLPELYEILCIARDVYERSDGAFDITVAPLVKLWAVSHSDENWMPPAKTDIAALLSHVGTDKLTFDGTILSRTDGFCEIDLGGIAKGYALGKCAEALTAKNAVGTVSFGGNIALVGQKSDGSEWRVGIKNPLSPDTLIGTLMLESGIVAVSGAYERYAEYEDACYHHIIDPQMGYPAESDLASVAIIVPEANAASGALADSLSTALFVMGRDAALEFYREYGDFEAVLIMADGEVTLTDGLEGRFAANE